MNPKNCQIKPEKTIIFNAVMLDAFVSNFILKIIAFILWVFGVGAILFLLADMARVYNLSTNEIGFSYILLALFLDYLALRSFYIAYLKYPKTQTPAQAIELLSAGKECNIFQSFSFQLAKTWIKNIRSENVKITNYQLIFAVLDSLDMNFILARMGVSRENVVKYSSSESANREANSSRHQPEDDRPLAEARTINSVTEIIYRALEIAKAESHHQIEIGDVFIALCEADANLAEFISDLKLDIADIANIVYWQTNVVRAEIKTRKRFFDPDDISLAGGIGRDWAFGNTLYLKQFSYDLTDLAAHHALNLEIIGHDKEIKQLEEALTRGQGGNAILVGDPGVGKRTTILGFAKKVYKGEVTSSLKNKHLFQVDIESLLAGASGGGEIVQKISGILNEAARAGNTVLFFENIQNLFSSGDAGKVNAAEVILPFLETPDLYIVGSCDIFSYSRYIENNSALMQRFSKINIEEPSKEEMIRILEDVVPTIEHHTSSLVSYSAVKETIKLADKYILNIPNPEKSINLLDGAAAKASADRGETIILPQDLDIYISEKYEVLSGDATEAEEKKLLALEGTMHRRVIGQEEAINAIANAMRRSRAQISESKKPIGSFLFLGTTGVGKTETAKALAEAYFGSEDKMVRFDMSEYQNKQDIYRLIGSSEGEEELPGILTSEIREHPFALVLLDEIEKAHPDILNLFLQVLDEGHLTDGSGRKVSFSNSIIIATSNAGANLIRESIQNGVQYEQIKKGLINQLQTEGIYRPEFLNRFTAVIIFSPLSLDQITQIANLMITKLKEDLAKNKGIEIEVAPDALRMLVQIGYDPVMGARPMQRTMSEKLENMLAKRILSGNLKKGDKITITAADIEP